MKSIIQIKNECFICKINYDVITTNNLTEYLIFNNYPKQSNKYQEKFKNSLELFLKQLAQNKFEEIRNRKNFIKQLNKSYL